MEVEMEWLDLLNSKLGVIDQMLQFDQSDKQIAAAKTSVAFIRGMIDGARMQIYRSQTRKLHEALDAAEKGE